MKQRIIEFVKKTCPSLVRKIKEWKSLKGYEFIAADITNNCNLRCPFCINSFSDRQPAKMMSREIFETMIGLTSLVGRGKFYLSCHFEPLIHPQFFHFLEIIPKKERPKVFFTTNLSLPVSDRNFRILAGSGIDHLKISLDTFSPGLFERLRKGAHYSVFMGNLRRLVQTFEETPDAPPLHFVTMALQPNFDEIPSLLIRCAKEFRAAFHEVRFVYEMPHFSLEWKKSDLLSPAQWAELRALERSRPSSVAVISPPENYFCEDGQFYSRSSPGGGLAEPESRPIALRIDSSGNVFLYGTERRFPLEGMKRPVRFFKRLRRLLA